MTREILLVSASRAKTFGAARLVTCLFVLLAVVMRGGVVGFPKEVKSAIVMLARWPYNRLHLDCDYHNSRINFDTSNR
jgi:hypothetical protein